MCPHDTITFSAFWFSTVSLDLGRRRFHQQAWQNQFMRRKYVIVAFPLHKSGNVAYTRHRHVISVSTVALCPLTSCCPYGLGLGRAVSGSVGLGRAVSGSVGLGRAVSGSVVLGRAGSGSVGQCRAGSGSVGQCRGSVTAGFGGLVPSFLGRAVSGSVGAG